ncbi:hypothetical protein F5Y15DRAFT_424757 [Xylariaceae sp. FL0016]|nr:hypothetical protein F5Y15DRAFT_424757 [Xylariaceae sp. FL0016]
MAHLEDLAIPKGSMILVTGASGLLGSNIVDKFLESGYKVRGTTRHPEKLAWLSDVFNSKHGEGSFELLSIPDMTAEGAFDTAAKGVAVVIHTASIMTLDPDPNKVVPGVIAGAVNALKSAYREPSVKRYVFCSSSSAVVVTSHDERSHRLITKDTWNEESVRGAWADPPYGVERSLDVYAASKTQSEQAVWRFHDENRGSRLDLVVNTVLPNMNFGKSLAPERKWYPSSSGLPQALWQGEVLDVHRAMPAQYYVNAQDVGYLHVAAAILPEVKDERIFGFAGRFNWDMILEIMRKHAPDRNLPGNFDGGEDPNEIAGRPRAEELLRQLGRPGWISLEDTILMNVGLLD